MGRSVEEVQEGVRRLLKALRDARGRWEDLSKRGLDVASEWVNGTLRLSFLDAPTWGRLDGFAGLQSAVAVRLEEERTSPRQALTTVLHDLTSVHLVMGDKVAALMALRDDVATHSGHDRAFHTPLFRTASLAGLVEGEREAHAMFTQELYLRTEIFHHLFDVTDRDTLQLYLTAWASEPFVETQRLAVLDAVVEAELEIVH